MGFWDELGSIGLGGLVGGPAGAALGGASGSLGGLQNVLLGGLGKSTNPSDYQVSNPQQAAISGAMGDPSQARQSIYGMLGQGAAQLNADPQAQFRAQQIAQAKQLQAIASGQQQGAGELAANRAVQQAIAQQQAMARMARGGANSALAFRNAANNSASTALTGAGTAQQAALQDQANAQGMLSNILNQGRSSDLSLAGQNAQLQQNQYGQQLGALGSMYGQNLGALTGLNAQQLQAQQGAMQAALGQQGILGGLLGTAGTVAAAGMGGGGAAGGAAAMGGGVGAGAAAGALASDRNLKTDVDEDAGADIDEMLSKLMPTAFRYKDETKYGAGKRAGVMAQNLEKSKLGRAMVRREPDGLKIDPNTAISTALAVSARLDQRMRKLEKKGKAA
jgi:hypothetical protein